jgi:uncharacterized protein
VSTPAANPFMYANPVPPEQLVDRARELDQLLSLTQAGHPARLAAPRRYGKTSLVRSVLTAAERDGHPTVYVNFYGILSVEDAIARLELGYRGLKGRLAGWVEGVLRTLQPTVRAPAIQVSPQLDTDAGRRLLSLLDLPRRAAVRAEIKVIVAFDEFQAVLGAKPPLDGALRSVIEQHGTHVGYLFSGSHPGMMRGLFADRERPFYGQARSVSLSPLSDEDLAGFISERFEATDRDAGTALGPLLDLVRGHPQRAMLSAHLLWEHTPPGGRADEHTFSLLLDDLEDELGEPLAGLWQGLYDSDRRALVAVASGPGSPTGKQALGAVGLARETARDAIDRLLDAGHLVEHGRQPVVTDPLLERWLVGGRIGLG